MHTIDLPEDIEAKLVALASQKNITVEEAIIYALREYFSWQEAKG